METSINELGQVVQTQIIDQNDYIKEIDWRIAKINNDIDNMQKEKEKLEQEKSKLFTKKIIGNVTKKGKSKIYHLPTDDDYSQVEYDKDRGDQLFNTEQEAIDAGFIHKK